MIDCWKRNKYLYSDLEEMFLINMQHNQDKELLARELGNTLGDDRYAKILLESLSVGK